MFIIHMVLMWYDPVITHLLYSYIALLFTCMLTHGVSPIDSCLSVIVPIPKNKRANKCDSSNVIER